MATNDPNKVQQSPRALEVTQTEITFGQVPKGNKYLYHANLWHKVIISINESWTRDFVLKTILDDVHPFDFIPVKYSAQGTTASFFARNCKLAIEKLCRQNLIVPNPQYPEMPLKLSLVLGYCTTHDLLINVQDNVSSVLSKRFSLLTKTLNLDSFWKDPGLTEYCTLAQPKILYFVLHLIKQYNIQTLKLSNNEIQILSPIETLWGVKTLTILDLRNNLIKNIAELNILKTMQITELFLDGNPICDLYDEYTYVQAVKEVCPKIEKLDGVLLGQKGFLAFRRNFLCNKDGQELVDQFLEHYFTLFDGPNRPHLENLYREDAMLSTTCQYLPGQTRTSVSLGKYKCISRNLKFLSDLAKSEDFLVRGSHNIIKTLCSLPKTEHDPYTFTVDLVYYTEETAVITVTGVFREVEQTASNSQKFLYFVRTFILASRSSGEYNITNEQIHITNSTITQQQRAFKISRDISAKPFTLDIPTTVKDKRSVEKAFMKLSTLNLKWSKKCLEDVGYDLRKALALFVDLYKVDKIPNEAFS